MLGPNTELKDTGMLEGEKCVDVFVGEEMDSEGSGMPEGYIIGPLEPKVLEWDNMVSMGN